MQRQRWFGRLGLLGRRFAVGAAITAAGSFAIAPVGNIPTMAIRRPVVEGRTLLPFPRSIPGRQPGYQLVTDGGDVLPFGTSPVGSAPVPLDHDVAGVAWTADGDGHWLATRDGGVITFGDAAFFGSAAEEHLTAPIAGIAATRSGRGYWLVAADGGVFAFGDATFHGSIAGTALRSHVVGIAPTRTDGGYWLAAADGGVFTFGDAKYRGGLTGMALIAPVVGMAVSRTGRGYWLAGADGGVFSFGDAPFLGSSGGSVWGKVVGIAGGSAHPRKTSAVVGAPAQLTSRYGHDVSWPQCDDPLPTSRGGYAIVGVTGGRPFRHNRCLAQQWQWATANGSGGALYVNLAAPDPENPNTMHGPAGDCAATNFQCQVYNFSANNVQYALDLANRAGADAPMWWLDVEVGNHWSPAQEVNALVVKATAETLSKAGKRVGIYSTWLQWRRITGDAQFGLPVWVAGAPTDHDAPAWCDDRRAFNGGQTWLVQSLPIHVDHNFACNPVADNPGGAFAFRRAG